MTRVVPQLADSDAKIARDKRGALPERLPGPPNHRARLPHGAKLEATYDAESVRWTGTLTANGKTAEASCGALMTLLHVLDSKLRVKLKVDYDGKPISDVQEAY